VRGNGFPTGVQALLGQLFAEPDDLVLDLQPTTRGSWCGRLDRGSNAASPSVLKRLTRACTQNRVVP
jgi:hypothetical protein